MSLRIVDLPDPLGPVRKANSPLCNWNDAWLSATPPRVYSLATLRNLTRLNLPLPQCLLEICNQVASIFETDAEAQESIRNTDLGAPFRRHRGMGRVTWLAYQRVHTAKTRRVHHDLQFLEKTCCTIATACEHESHHSTETVEALLRDLMVGMRFETGIQHLRELGTRLAPLRQLHRIVVLAPNADVERLHAALEQPHRKRIGRLPPYDHLSAHFFDV